MAVVLELKGLKEFKLRMTVTGTKRKVLTPSRRNMCSLFPESSRPCGDFPTSGGTSESRQKIKIQHRRRIRATNMSVYDAAYEFDEGVVMSVRARS